MSIEHKETMRARILGIADQLFYQEGIRSAGMDKVIATAGIAKATLYRHFPTKEALVLAYLQQRHETILGHMQQLLRDSARQPPEARITALFDWVAGRVASGHFRGCAFLLALGEYGHVPRVREAVQAHKQAVRKVLEQAVGERLHHQHPELVQQIALLYDGGLAAASVQQSTQGLQSASSLACALLKQASKAAPPA